MSGFSASARRPTGFTPDILLTIAIVKVREALADPQDAQVGLKKSCNLKKKDSSLSGIAETYSS